MHFKFDWPLILTSDYWFPKAKEPQKVKSISIRNIISREAGEPDCLIAVLIVDNVQIDEHDPDHIDLEQLSLCLTSSGTFFPWTCSCGCPGCAGRFEGVIVSHNGDKSTWLDQDSKRHYEFSTSMLHSSFRKAIEEGSQMLAQSPGLQAIPVLNAAVYQQEVN